MKVQPIHRLKDVRAIKKLIADSPRDAAIFVIGINTNLRASDILGLTIGQVRGMTPGCEIEIIEEKTQKRRRITFNDEAVCIFQMILDLSLNISVLSLREKLPQPVELSTESSDLQ